MENIGTDYKEYIYFYASDHLCSQIKKLMSKRDKVRKTKMQHAKIFWLDPIGKLGKPPCQHPVPEVMIYRTAYR